MLLRLPRSTLFPYTTLFRSSRRGTATWRRRSTAARCVLARPSPPSPPPWDPSLLRTGSGALLRPKSPRCPGQVRRSEEHTSELQSHSDLVCRILLEKKHIEQ